MKGDKKTTIIILIISLIITFYIYHNNNDEVGFFNLYLTPVICSSVTFSILYSLYFIVKEYFYSKFHLEILEKNINSNKNTTKSKEKRTKL